MTQPVNYASRMLQNAGIEYTERELAALKLDLDAIAAEDYAEDYRDAVTLLTRRIGGLQNLRSYLDCIVISYHV